MVVKVGLCVHESVGASPRNTRKACEPQKREDYTLSKKGKHWAFLNIFFLVRNIPQCVCADLENKQVDNWLKIHANLPPTK